MLVVPSLWPENSPLVIHEAFMCGIPVIGANVGGIPDLVTDGVSGMLYEAFSAAALAERLQRIVDRPELLAAFASAVPAVKTMEADAAEWDARYRRLARPGGGPA